MDLKTTSIELCGVRRNCGYTLAEVLIMLPVAALCLAALLTVSLFATRSFHALINYAELSGKNRYAANVMIREIRQANRVDSCSANVLVLVDSDGSSITYTFNATSGTLTRLKNGVSKVLLTGCDRLKFDLGERNPVEGTYDVYPAATAATAKVIDISWLCSRTILGVKQNSESVQTARVVIRKQGT
jgi:hypothetical protein